MFIVIFATGLVSGSLGVFSLLMLETVFCSAVFVSFLNAGFLEACWKSVETGGVLTAGFICTIIFLYLSEKFRFRPLTLRQRDETGLMSMAAGHEPEPIKVGLPRFGGRSRLNSSRAKRRRYTGISGQRTQA